MILVAKHADPPRVRQELCEPGFRWNEIDVSYYLLVARSKFGVIWDVRRAPAHVVAVIAQPATGHS